MSAAGRYTLGSLAIAAAGTVVTDWASGLGAMQSLSCLLNFVRTSGGTTCTVYLQTSLDGGVTAIDIAAVQFTTSSGVSAFNVRADTSVTPYSPTDGSLSTGTVKDGIIGDRIRAKVVVVGTYAGSSLEIDVVTR